MTGRARGRKLSPAELPTSAPEWSGLVKRMSGCDRCALAGSRRHVVIYRGGPSPWLLFVGEAPGRQEDEQGLPFVGRAGQLLDTAALGAGLRPEDWGVTNVIMCRPPQNRFDREAASACRPWLGAKVAALRPKVIATLGSHALEAFLPEELPISSAAGRLLSWSGLPLFPMLHPASTLRARAYAERWREDWAKFARVLPVLRGPVLPRDGREQTPIRPSGVRGP